MAQRTLSVEQQLGRALARRLNPDIWRKDQTPKTRATRDIAYASAFNLCHRHGYKIPTPPGEPISADLRAALDKARNAG